MTTAALVAFVVSLLVSGAVVLLAEAFDDDGSTTATPTTVPSTEGPSTLGSAFDLSELIETMTPSVVTVQAGPAAGDGGYGSGSGAGVVLGDGTRVVTTDRVVRGATRSTVTIRLADGSELDADVLGTSTSENLAVLVLRDGARLTEAVPGSLDPVAAGSPVLALGDAFVAAGAPSASAGVVTSTGRVVADGDYQLDHLIETDVAVTPGSAGGALVSRTGEVVGVLTALAPADGGVGYAIAIDEVERAVAQIIAGADGDADGGADVGGAPFLGVTVVDIADLSAEDLDRYGVTVTDGTLVLGMAEDGGAAAAGMAIGDVILSVDGVATNTRSEVADAVARLEPGRVVEVEVLRAATTVTISVTVGARTDG